MKRTCTGCRALSLETCELGHIIRSSGFWPHIRYHPTEECEKPRTVQEYIQIVSKGGMKISQKTPIIKIDRKF